MQYISVSMFFIMAESPDKEMCQISLLLEDCTHLFQCFTPQHTIKLDVIPSKHRLILHSYSYALHSDFDRYDHGQNVRVSVFV